MTEVVLERMGTVSINQYMFWKLTFQVLARKETGNYEREKSWGGKLERG